jgi:tetratricopeptide (TPR) repeat protein
MVLRFISLFFLVTTLVSAQRLDSLMAVLDTARNENKVKTLNELFRAHIQFDPLKAVGYSREALNLGTEIDDRRGMAAAYNNIGVAYKNQGAFEKALEFYINALKIYESLDNKEGIATARNNISNIYAIKGDYGQAIKYLEEARSLLAELNDQQKLIGTLNNLGNIHYNLKLYDKALENFTESFQLSEKLGQPFADPLNNIGNVYFSQNNLQRAIEFHLRALEIEKKASNRLGMLNTLANIGIAYTKANQPQPALTYLNEAYALARELQANAEMPEILKNSSYNLYRLGNLKEAYSLLLKYDSAREKVYGEESTRRIAQMEMALELSDKEREYEALKKTAELKTLQLKNSRLFIVLMILSGLIVVAFLNYFLSDKLKEFFKGK